jgi:hypothetical protein
MVDWKEVFIKRNVEFSRKDLLRVKGVIVTKLHQDLACFSANTSDQGIEYSEVRGAPGFSKVVEVGRQDFVNSIPRAAGSDSPTLAPWTCLLT